MKDNGLQDSELQTYHHSLEYTGNFFLSEILESSYFITETDDTHTKIYPTFYCTEISTDHQDQVMINSPYMIIVPNDFKGLIHFQGNDGQTITTKDYDLVDNDTYYTIAIYDDKTKEVLPNQTFTISYTGDYADETYTTTSIGYWSFVPKNDSFEVII